MGLFLKRVDFLRRRLAPENFSQFPFPVPKNFPAVPWGIVLRNRMMITSLTGDTAVRYFLLLLVSPVLLLTAKNQIHDWKTGKVLDSETAKTYLAADANTDRVLAVRDTQLAIVTDEFAYVIEDTREKSGFTNVHSAVIHAVSGRHHGCRFIVGDSVKFYQDKSILHVIDADGKECKTEVLRQERMTK
jgi:hypothetical protein